MEFGSIHAGLLIVFYHTSKSSSIAVWKRPVFKQEHVEKSMEVLRFLIQYVYHTKGMCFHAFS